MFNLHNFEAVFGDFNHEPYPNPDHSPQALCLRHFGRLRGLLSAYGNQKHIYQGMESSEWHGMANWQCPEGASSSLLLHENFSLNLISWVIFQAKSHSNEPTRVVLIKSIPEALGLLTELEIFLELVKWLWL